MNMPLEKLITSLEILQAGIEGIAPEVTTWNTPARTDYSQGVLWYFHSYCKIMNHYLITYRTQEQWTPEALITDLTANRFVRNFKPSPDAQQISQGFLFIAQKSLHDIQGIKNPTTMNANRMYLSPQITNSDILALNGLLITFFQSNLDNPIYKILNDKSRKPHGIMGYDYWYHSVHGVPPLFSIAEQIEKLELDRNTYNMYIATPTPLQLAKNALIAVLKHAITSSAPGQIYHERIQKMLDLFIRPDPPTLLEMSEPYMLLLSYLADNTATIQLNTTPLRLLIGLMAAEEAAISLAQEQQAREQALRNAQYKKQIADLLTIIDKKSRAWNFSVNEQQASQLLYDELSSGLTNFKDIPTFQKLAAEEMQKCADKSTSRTWLEFLKFVCLAIISLGTRPAYMTFFSAAEKETIFDQPVSTSTAAR